MPYNKMHHTLSLSHRLRSISPTVYIRFLCLLLVCGSCIGLECNDSPYLQDAEPFVNTDSGSIVGKYVKVFDRDVLAFLGIPFAEPPVGEKRFKKPTPVKPWDGVRRATKLPPPCQQYSSIKFDWIPTSESFEDCLYLNVWVPKMCPSPGLLPVVVWIYGGGYFAGSTDISIYDGSTLASYGNVIIVSMNYRVGAFGFLYTGEKDELGNAGLYDQNLAMKWIRKNIPYFGGDPDGITLMGESAGAWSVGFHMVSPLSQNLYRRVIMQSGSPFHPVLTDTPQSATFKAIEFARLVGCTKENDWNFSRVVQCLKEKDPRELAKAGDTLVSKHSSFFIPTIDGEFLPISPLEVLLSGDLPQVEMLSGNDKNEATIVLHHLMPHVFDLYRNPVLTLADAEKIVRKLFETSPSPPADRIFDFYFQNVSENSTEIARAIADSYGDYPLTCPGLYLAEKMQNAYVYWFTHRSTKEKKASWLGVPHFSEVYYVFGVPTHDTYNYTPEDSRFSLDVMQNWVDFVKQGHPSPDEHNWPSYKKNMPFAYELNPMSYRKLWHPRLAACEFWRPYILWNPK